MIRHGFGSDSSAFSDRHFLVCPNPLLPLFPRQPLLDAKDLDIDFDSATESDDDGDDDDDAFEDDDPFSTAAPPAENTEHANPNSYSWCLMRYACIRLAQNMLEKFVATAGIEIPGKWKLGSNPLNKSAAVPWRKRHTDMHS